MARRKPRRDGLQNRARVLAFVRANPHSSFREVAAGVGLSVSIVYYHCVMLRLKDAVDFRDGVHRTLHAKGKP